MNQQADVLITGATGFIGSHLATRLIQEGRRTRCLVRGSSPTFATEYLRGLGAELVGGDLSDPPSLDAAVAGVSTVFHLAGGGTVDMVSDDDFRQLNVDLTRNVLEAAANSGAIKRFVHMSTCGVMGDIRNPPADETAPYRPEAVAYSRSKTEAEELAFTYHDKVPLVVVRMPGVYGPPVFEGDAARLSGVTPLLMLLTAVKNGRWRFIGDGSTLTHWVHIDDAVQGLVLAAERGGEDEVYIIAGEQWLTMREFVEIAARVLGVDTPTRTISVPLARAVATLVEMIGRLFGRTPRLRREMVTAFLVNRAFDISKARRELGYEPKVGLEEGMRETVRWFEDKGYLQ